MPGAQLGVVGLGAMGENLALNAEDHGFRVAVWDSVADRVETFVAAWAGRRIVATSTAEALVKAVDPPRRILVLVPAGTPVDEAIDRLLPHLEEGDVIIDGGNSWFLDTRERARRLEERGIRFAGVGISGGEDGARLAASVMAGCTPDVWRDLRDVFEAIAARSDSRPCATRVGPDGAGHFVKMVHNGIEYADVQLIAEAYEVLRKSLALRTADIAATFEEWNRGPLESFLIGITARILRVIDPETGEPLVEKVCDRAGQKGTGRWATRTALDLGVPVPTITAAVDARLISSSGERKAAREAFETAQAAPVSLRVSDVHDALKASRLCAWSQAMSLIRRGSDEWAWSVDLREILRVWTAGCIIEGRVLMTLLRAYERDPALALLLADPDLRRTMDEVSRSWRRVVSTAQSSGLAIPAMAASLAWFDALRTARLPQNLTQAQRDLFGGHKYQRNDRGENAPFVHDAWKPT